MIEWIPDLSAGLPDTTVSLIAGAVLVGAPVVCWLTRRVLESTKAGYDLAPWIGFAVGMAVLGAGMMVHIVPWWFVVPGLFSMWWSAFGVIIN